MRLFPEIQTSCAYHLLRFKTSFSPVTFHHHLFTHYADITCLMLVDIKRYVQTLVLPATVIGTSYPCGFKFYAQISAAAILQVRRVLIR
jgi:hypothetical protein